MAIGSRVTQRGASDHIDKKPRAGSVSGRMSTSRAPGGRLFAIALPAAALLFLVSYSYLGAATGSPLFRFLVNTSLGNAVLGLAAACYAYHVARGYTSPATASGGLSLLEGLHPVLLFLSLAAVSYPVFWCLLGAPRDNLAAVPALPSFAASASILLLVEGWGGRPVRIAGYFSTALIAVAALRSADRLTEAFAELARLVAYAEALARELGVVQP